MPEDIEPTPSFERRIMEFIKDGFSRIEKSIGNLDSKTDELMRTSATKSELNGLQERIESISSHLATHEAREGHPVALQRISQLENEGRRIEERPMKTWQVIAGIIGIIISLSFVGFSALGSLISIINLLIGLHIIGK